LQNYGSSKAPVVYFEFDVTVLTLGAVWGSALCEDVPAGLEKAPWRNTEISRDAITVGGLWSQLRDLVLD
jgi:hypothetical protein